MSLSELIKGLAEHGKTKSTVITFQSQQVLGELFEDGSVISLNPLLNYRTRSKYLSFFDKNSITRLFSKPASKLYALLDIVNEFFLTKRISRVARFVGADIIHANNYLTPTALNAAKSLNLPLVAHFRGFVRSSPKGIKDRFGSDVFDTLQKCIGISKAVSSSIAAFGVPPELISTIHNPVSSANYSITNARRCALRSRYGIDSTHIVVSVFGRVTPWKGQLEFLEAILPLLNTHDELRVFIVGDESDSGSLDYSENVKSLASSPAAAGKVVMTGYQHDVAEFYGASDIVVHCSQEPEPFGRVVIEAMASGKPTIAMAEGGPPEIITDNLDGLLVPPRDLIAMQLAILRLLREPETRARLGLEARSTIMNRFTPNASAQQFLTAIGIDTRR